MRISDLTIPQRALDVILQTDGDPEEFIQSLEKAARIIVAAEFRTFARGLRVIMDRARIVDPAANSYGNVALGIASDLERRADELDPTDD
jgi:hypothetical protein